jgi:hypothetical protein
MTGQHRASGRHRKPAVPNLGRRRVVMRVICGCAFCAVVIPIFAQPTATASPPDLTSARPVLSVVPSLAPPPPAFTIQPQVDMLSAVTTNPARHHDSSRGDDKSTSSSDTSSNSNTDTSTDSSDDSTPSSSDTGHHPHKANPDYHQTVPPVPPNCQ